MVTLRKIAIPVEHPYLQVVGFLGEQLRKADPSPSLLLSLFYTCPSLHTFLTIASKTAPA